MLGAAAWGLLVVPLWLVMVLCTRWEPVLRDGWGHVIWYRAYPFGADTLYAFCKEAYATENPRLGQLFTLVSYLRGPFHMLVTPLVELAGLWLVTVLALGRWPSVRRSDDALVGWIVTAALAACVPQVGSMLFYRPFTGNYVWGLVLNLAWLVPYRLELATPRPGRWWLAPIMLGLGLAAGLCNEHTGLAFLAMAALASGVALRRGGLRVWMVAGLLGLAAGYWLLLTAPGQHVRYAGLADQAGILTRIAERGVVGNLVVVGALARTLLPALPLLVLAVVERRAGGPPRSPQARWPLLALVLGGVACALTLLASPKLGPRLYLASVALVTAGLVGWLAVHLHRRWARRACAILAAGTLAFVAVRLISIYRVVGPLGELRLARIEAGAPGSIVKVPRYPFDASRYFLGDDFLVSSLRETIAANYGLAGVQLEPTPENP